MQTCTDGYFHSHTETLGTLVAMSEAPEPASILEPAQTLPVHLVPGEVPQHLLESRRLSHMISAYSCTPFPH